MKLLSHYFPPVIADDVIVGSNAIGGDLSADFLTADENRKFHSFESKNRQREYLSTRKLIREAALQLDLNPAQFELKKSSLGQPYGQLNGHRYYVSIAHAGDCVLCSLSSSVATGVDMEPSERAVPAELRRRILHPDEKQPLARLKTIRIWTMKEALVKLEGRGMRTNLNQCVLQKKDDNLFTASLRNNKTARIWSFHHCSYWLALAWYN